MQWRGGAPPAGAEDSFNGATSRDTAPHSSPGRIGRISWSGIEARCRTWFAAALVVFAGALLSRVPSLNNGFVIDDFKLVVNNGFIAAWQNAREFVDPQSYAYPYHIEHGARPLVLVSLMADRALWGLKPAGYHLTNIFLHAANALLLFVLVSLLLPGSSPFVPAVAGLIFALHPVQSEAVNVISFRGDLLAVFFYLVALALFVRADRATGRFVPAALATGGIVLGAAALLSKEIAVTLPAAYLAYRLIFSDRRRIGAPDLAPAFLAVLAALFLVFFWRDRFDYSLDRALFLNILGGVSPLSSAAAYLNTLAASALHAARCILLPVGLSVEYQVAVAQTFWSPHLALGILAAAAFAVLLFAERDPAVRFGLVFAAVAYLPVSNLVPLVNTVADRYLYLPLAGVSLAGAVLIGRLSAVRVAGKMGGAVAAAGAILLVFGTVSLARNAEFRDMYTLYAHAVRRAPQSARAHYHFALALMERQEWVRAAEEFRSAAAGSPLYQRDVVLRSLGLCHQRLGEFDAAAGYYRRSIALKPSREALTAFADLLWQAGNGDGAVRLLEESVAIAPDAVSYNNIGTYYATKRNYRKAIAYFMKAIDQKPGYVDAWINLVNACEATGDRALAAREAGRAALVLAREGVILHAIP